MKYHKLLSLLLLGGMILHLPTSNVIIAATEAADATPSTEIILGTQGTSVSETIYSFNYGTAEGELLFNSIMNEGNGAGPEAFLVDGNSIYVLDSLDQKLEHYINGVYVDSATLTSVSAPQCFTLTSNGTIYVCDAYNGKGKLFVYNDNILNDMYYIDLSDAKNIYVNADGIIQITNWYELYTYIVQNNELILLSKKELETSEVSENSYSRLLSQDSQYRYELQTQLAISRMLLGEICVAALDSMHNIVASARIPLEEFLYRPNQYIQIGTDGIVYLMVPTESHLEIREITLGTVCDSKFNEIEAYAQSYEAQTLSQNTPAITDSISLTRQQVLERANLIASHRWTLSLSNTAARTNVTLPDFVQTALSDGSLNNSATLQITGIPYCWGGFDSQYTSNNSGYSTFDDAIAAGYTAGNVNPTSKSKVANTAGLDCSGFVSAAYGFSGKQGTSYFSTFGSEVTTDTIDTMDFIVRYNYSNKANHVLLFYNWQANDKSKMLIIEANNPNDYDDKTLIRIVNTDDYLNNGYVMRSPW